MLTKYTCPLGSKDLLEQVESYFNHFNRQDTFKHTQDVIEELNVMHKIHDFDYEKAYKACLLHDIGRVVEKNDLVQVCHENGHTFTQGEKDLPNILHQIASKIIAEKVFKVSDSDVLKAIECHTTLKANPSLLEEVVFLSDKLSWKEQEHQEQVNILKSKMKISIEAPISHYLNKMHSNRHEMKCYHDWSRAAYKYYCNL